MQLPDEDHVLRHASYKRLNRDCEGKILGLLPQAFALRPKDKGLSVNWLEYFDGDQHFQIKESIRELKSVQDIRKSSAFGVAKVSSVKNICINNKLTVKIVYTPRNKILSHSEIRQLPMDDLLIQEALAYEAFTKLIPNSEIEQ